MRSPRDSRTDPSPTRGAEVAPVELGVPPGRRRAVAEYEFVDDIFLRNMNYEQSELLVTFLEPEHSDDRSVWLFDRCFLGCGSPSSRHPTQRWRVAFARPTSRSRCSHLPIRDTSLTVDSTDCLRRSSVIHDDVRHNLNSVFYVLTD